MTTPVKTPEPTSWTPTRLTTGSLVITLGLIISTLVWTGCRTTPVTGRKQLLLMPENQEVTMGAQAFSQVLEDEPVSTQRRHIEMVERVGRRIAAVAGKPEYEWDFKVIRSDQQNAFCLPGGKVAVYEGILPVCENEAGLAVVMAHEIAHALARHGGERMAHSAVSNGVQKAIGYAMQDQEERHQKMVLTAYGAASRYGAILPYSRKHESEADHIGLMLMAKAGYDPREAPLFWERFAHVTEGGQPPEFLSTHPSHDRRAGDLRRLLPEALQKYEAATVQYGLGDDIRTAATGT